MKKISCFSILLLGIVLLTTCKKEKTPDSVPLLTADLDGKFANEWFDLSLKITKTTDGFSAPVAARAFGYLGLTLYESVVSGMPGFHSLQGQLNGFTTGVLPAPETGPEYHWGLCANSALAALTKRLYKTSTADNLDAIRTLSDEYDLLFSKYLSLETVERSKLYGEALGKAMYEYSVSDGHDAAYDENFPASYVAPTVAGAWKQTPPTFQPIPLQPYWGSVRPFLSENINETQPDAPPAYSTSTNSVFFAQALEVYVLSVNLQPEQIKIAQFWNDEPGQSATPAGHSMAILKQILESKNADLATAAEAYAKVGMGVHDAFVSCWKSKYDYNLLRPVSYIRTQLDPAFNPLLTTPPFPEYTSEHAVQSAATAQILSDLFGYTYGFTDQTNAGRSDIDGSPRSFDTFLEFAEEAGNSRLLGGVQYQASITSGHNQGLKIGRNIGEMSFRR